MQDVLPFIIASKSLSREDAKKFLLLGRGVPEGLSLYAFNDLVKSVAGKDKRITDLEDNLEQLNKDNQKLSDLAKSLPKKQARITELEGDLEKLINDNQKLNVLAESLPAKETRITELEAELECERLSNKALNAKLSSAQSDLEKNSKEISDIKSELETFQTAYKTAIRSITHDYWNDQAVKEHAEWVARPGKPAQRYLTEIAFDGPYSTEMNKYPGNYAQHKEGETHEYQDAKTELETIAKNFKRDVQRVFRNLSDMSAPQDGQAG